MKKRRRGKDDEDQKEGRGPKKESRDRQSSYA